MIHSEAIKAAPHHPALSKGGKPPSTDSAGATEFITKQSEGAPVKHI